MLVVLRRNKEVENRNKEGEIINQGEIRETQLSKELKQKI